MAAEQTFITLDAHTGVIQTIQNTVGPIPTSTVDRTYIQVPPLVHDLLFKKPDLLYLWHSASGSVITSLNPNYTPDG